MVSFIVNSFLKKNQLESGSAYVWKDGHVRLYLGESKKSGEMVFYTVCCMAFDRVSDGHIQPLWGDRQQSALLAMCSSILSLPYNSSALETYNTMPSIYGSIGVVYSTYNIDRWLEVNGRGGSLNFSRQGKNPVREAEYVTSKELKPGRLYYGGADGHRNTWMYVGKNIQGEYLWFFISNEEAFKEGPCRWMRSSRNYGDFITTKSIKRLRPLTRVQNKLLGGFEVDLNPILEYLTDIHDLVV